jgi:hypothetical protein
MTWIRWDCGAARSGLALDLAAALRVQPMLAYGCYVSMCEEIGLHTPSGHLAGVLDAQLEVWAQWPGKKGAFAAAVRARCQDADGRLRGWWRQDKLMTRREKDRERKRNSAPIPQEFRRNGRGGSAEPPPDIRVQTETETETVRNELPPPPPAGEPFEALLARVANPNAFTAERAAMLAGMPGHATASAEQVDRACADLLANTAPGQPIGMGAFRSFVESEAARGQRRSRRHGASGTAIDFDPARAY